MQSFDLNFTTLSSKGQIVLPRAVRSKHNLNVGMKFLIIAHGDTVVLKKVSPPSFEDAKELLKASQAYARKVGLKPSDLKAALRRVRARSQ